MKATRNLQIATAAAVLLLCGAAAPAQASVTGAWEVGGKLTTWFVVKGEEPKRESVYGTDIYAFFPGGRFVMSGGLDGLWKEDGGEFGVELSAWQIEEYFEKAFADEGFRTDVTVRKARVKGQQSESDEVIRGELAMKLDLWFIDYGVPGRIKANFRFEGLRAEMIDPVRAAEAAAPAAPATGLLRDLAGSIRTATPRRP